MHWQVSPVHEQNKTAREPNRTPDLCFWCLFLFKTLPTENIIYRLARAKWRDRPLWRRPRLCAS